MSIVTQTYQNWELIIVDDGSDDRREVEKIIMKFDDKRIRYIPIEHSGVVGAQMVGYNAARGDILTVQASDDLSLPNRLEKAVQGLQGHDVFIHSLYVNVFEAKNQCMLRNYRKAVPKTKASLLKEQGINGVPVFRKKVIRKCPLREETRDAYDWMQMLDWVFNGFKFNFSDEALYEYVRHTNSLSERNEREGKRAEALEKIGQIMKDEYNVKFNPIG